MSDVFDLAGAPALPQDSFDLAAEYGPSNYDARQLFSYSAVYTFRAGGVLEINVAVSKAFRFDEAKAFVIRSEFFNLTDRANFGVPVRFLEAPAFGRATSTLTPGRRVQFFLKYVF